MNKVDQPIVVVPALPTPDPIRQKMIAAGWVLVLDETKGRPRREVWDFRRGIFRNWASITLRSGRRRRDRQVPDVKGKLETIMAGMAILIGEKGAESGG